MTSAPVDPGVVGVVVTAVAVAVKVTTGTLATLAVSVLVPAVAPRIQRVGAAMPLASLATEPPTTVPAPLATLNVTVVPLTALPNASLTRTDGAVATAAFTVAL